MMMMISEDAAAGGSLAASRVAAAAGRFSAPFKLLLAVAALTAGLFAYIVGPPIYWQIRETMAETLRHASSSSSLSVSSLVCPPCLCNCPSSGKPLGPDPDLQSDCAKVDPITYMEMNKTTIEVLVEELKLQEVVTTEFQKRVDSALEEFNKLSYHSKNEAEKCSLAMETCEEFQEKTAAALRSQQKLSALWEKRARERGWPSNSKMEPRKLSSPLRKE